MVQGQERREGRGVPKRSKQGDAGRGVDASASVEQQARTTISGASTLVAVLKYFGVSAAALFAHTRTARWARRFPARAQDALVSRCGRSRAGVNTRGRVRREEEALLLVRLGPEDCEPDPEGRQALERARRGRREEDGLGDTGRGKTSGKTPPSDVHRTAHPQPAQVAPEGCASSAHSQARAVARIRSIRRHSHAFACITRHSQAFAGSVGQRWAASGSVRLTTGAASMRRKTTLKLRMPFMR